MLQTIVNSATTIKLELTEQSNDTPAWVDTWIRMNCAQTTVSADSKASNSGFPTNDYDVPSIAMKRSATSGFHTYVISRKRTRRGQFTAVSNYHLETVLLTNMSTIQEFQSNLFKK